MKKKRLTGILALASCVTLLTGCNPDALWGLGKYWNQVADGTVGFFNDIAVKLGLKEAEKKDEKKEEEKKDEGKEEGQEEQKKEVVLTIGQLPAQVFVGETLDLDEFVSVENSEESFAVALDSRCADIASVEGHKISVLDEGEVRFTVSVEDKSASGSFNGMSEMRSMLIDMFEGAGRNYIALELDQQGKVDGTILHGDNFLETDQWDYVEPENEGEEGYYLAGGFLQFPEHNGVYAFTVEGENEDEVKCDSYVYQNDIMEMYNGEFSAGVDFATALREFDADLVAEGEDPLEVLTISGKAAQAFAQNSLLAAQGGWTFTVEGQQVSYKCSKVQFLVADASAEDADEPFYVAEVLAYITMSGVDYIVGDYLMTADPEFVGDDVVEAFIADESNIPAGDNYAQLMGLGSLFTQYIPYYGATASFEYGWYDTVNKAFMDPESAEYKTFFASDVSGTILQTAPVGSSMRLFSDNGILNYAAGVGFTDGLVQNVTGDTDPVVTVYDLEAGEQGYELYENTRLETVYDDPVLSLSGLSSVWSSNALYLQGAQNVGTEDDPLMMYAFVLNCYEGYPAFDALCKSESSLATLISICNTYASRLDLRSYFDCTVIYAPAAGYFNARFDLLWDDSHSYSVDITISLGNQNAAYEEAFIASLFAEPAQD